MYIISLKAKPIIEYVLLFTL